MWRWCVSVLAVTLAARAAESWPLQVSVWPPVQLVCSDSDVQGLRLNLPYGDNAFVTGLDLGVAGGSECSTGIQINALNWVRDLSTGLQIGLVNSNRAAEGLSIGLMNTVQTHMTGLQVGVLNYAEDYAGMQIGLINTVQSMVGLQIGLVNIIRDAHMQFIPVINWEF